MKLYSARVLTRTSDRWEERENFPLEESIFLVSVEKIADIEEKLQKFFREREGFVELISILDIVLCPEDFEEPVELKEVYSRLISPWEYRLYERKEEPERRADPLSSVIGSIG